MILCSGTESFLTSLLDVLETDLAISVSSLHCLKLDPKLRKKIAESLVPSSKTKVTIVLCASFWGVKLELGIALCHTDG